MTLSLLYRNRIWQITRRWELLFNPRSFLIGFSLQDLTVLDESRGLCLFLNLGPFIFAWTEGRI